MKRLLFSAVLFSLVCIPLGSVSARSAMQNAKLDFTLINKTGLAIHELYVSPAKDDQWGEDILGRDVLKDGGKLDITFSPKSKACVWDMKIVDEEKDSVEWE